MVFRSFHKPVSVEISSKVTNMLLKVWIVLFQVRKLHFTWVGWVYIVYLSLHSTWVFLCPFGPTWVHLGLSVIPWVSLDSLASLGFSGFTWVYRFTWVYPCLSWSTCVCMCLPGLTSVYLCLSGSTGIYVDISWFTWVSLILIIKSK